MKQPHKHWFSPLVSWLSEASHIYLIIFVVLFAASGSILLFSSHALTGLKSPIQGLLDRGGLGSSTFNMPNATELSQINGVVANVSWSQLQSSQGGAINATNQLNSALQQVAAYNSSHSHQLEVKARVFAGTDAPNWAKSLDGWNPVSICNRQNGGSNCGTIGPFWTTDYDNAYKTFMIDLADATDINGYTYDNDPLLHDVTIAQCMTTYAEPFQRDDTGPNDTGGLGEVLYYSSSGGISQPNYTGLPYSVSNDENCLTDSVDNMGTAWKHTNISYSFNPFKPWTNVTTQSSSPGETFTNTVMQHCRAVLGSQCTLENNSIRDSYIGQQNQSGNLYYDITNKGPDITYQTATNNSVGNLDNTITWAAQIGANAVELPGGYSLTSSQMSTLSSALLSNPTAGTTPQNPSISSVSPTSGTTLGGTSVSIGLSNFPSGTPSSVTFGGTAGTNIARSGNTVSVTTPAHAAGAVSVDVTVGSSSATESPGYTYNTPTPQYPDLIVQSLGVSPSSPSVGDDVSFSMVVKNQGQTAVPSGTAIGGAFLIDGTDVTLERGYSSGLAVGATTTLTANQGSGSNPNSFWVATAGSHSLEGYVNDNNAIQESDTSNNTKTLTLVVPTPPPPQAPNPPTNITSPSQATSSITLDWTASVPGTNGDPDSKLTYYIERDGTVEGHTAEGVNPPTYTDTGLSPGVTYSYTIYATDTAGRSSDPSAPFTQATASLNCATPAAPGNFTGQPSSDGTSVALSWSAVTAKAPCSIDHYDISQNGVTIGSATTTSYNATNLTPATLYTFTVLAVTNDGHAGATSTYQITTPSVQDTSPPTAPTNLSGQAVSSSQINLSWTAASDPQSGIADYEILRDGTMIGTATSSDTTFGDTNLDPNTSYSYIVIAVNGVGLTTLSTQINVTTLPVTSGNGSGSGTGSGSTSGSGSSVTLSQVSPLLQNTTSVGAGTDAGSSGQSYNPTSANPVSDNPTAANTTPGSKAKVDIGLSPAARIVSGIVGVALIVAGVGYGLILLRRSQRSLLHPDLSFLHPATDSGSRLTAGTIIRPNVHHDDQEPKS